MQIQVNYVPLLESKLVIPEIPDKALLSQRINDLDIAGHRATIITAPAGFGKTTAVLLSLQNHREHIRWYRLEEDDSFLPLFYAHLMETLFPEKNRETLDSIHSLASINNIASEYLLQNALICQDAWMLFSQRPQPLYLVLDDFHNVLENSLIAESIRYFIANMPKTVRIIVISRTETGILSGKLAFDQRISRIGADELRFTEGEAEKLLAEKYRLDLTPCQMKQVITYSEGWIAGLTMICRLDNPMFFQESKGSYIIAAPDLSGRFRHYFSEFINKIDQAMLLNLAKISILPDFSCADLEAVFHMQDAEDVVQWLEQKNMYIQKYMTRPVMYRFHSLFRMELDAYLHEHVSEIEIQGMHLDAARHYQRCGELCLAIRFYIIAGQIDAAVKIAADEGVRILHSGNPEKIIPVILEFPDDCVQSDPYLLLFRGISVMNLNPKESYQCFLNSLLLFRKSRDVTLMMDALGMTIPMSFVKNNFAYIKSSLSLVPKLRVLLTDKDGRRKLLLAAFMGAAGSDRLWLGGFLYRILEHMDISEPVWEYCFYLVKGVVLYRRGKLTEALKNNDKILGHEVARRSDQWKIIALSSCHNGPWLSGDMEASQRYRSDFAALAEKYDSPFARGYALRLAAYNKHQTLDFSGMIELMNDAAYAFSQDGNPVMVCVINTTRYLWEAEAKEPQPYAELAAEELNKLQALHPSQGFIELCKTITGALYKECGRYDEAEALLKHAYETSRRKGARQSMCGPLLHMADLYYRRNNFDAERKCLAIFGRIVTRYGYEYFREMNYTTLIRVCARCMEKGIYPHKMRRIITRYFGERGADLISENPSTAVIDPKAFMANFSPSKQGPNIIRVEFFGSFKLCTEGMQIDDTAWKTRKTGGILKYILASAGKAVPREALAAMFWPESEAKAASTSLRAALYELRKALARFDLAFESETALLAENKNGFLVAEDTIVQTDVNDFIRLYEGYGSGKLPSEEVKHALVGVTQLYKGDFLEEDPYDEWVIMLRERYRSMYVEASHSLAQIYWSAGEFDAAQSLLQRLMEIDPLDEEACGLLIGVYQATDQKNRASSLRRQFVKHFEAEMGIKPELSVKNNIPAAKSAVFRK